MLLSIIIVSYNTKELLEACLDSIKASLDNQKNKKIENRKSKIENLSLSDIEVIIVDNNSTDGTREYLKQLTVDSQKLKVKTILNDDNAGFAKAVNQGIRVARGKYVLLLNSDIRVLSGSIEKLIKLMDSK
ncbi:MAG: glycosyltransferase, partial [Candidatus Shapirobacteria bacterium]|nr:glycosyltransferase [Candidatus Shapirobacteria bacterium]